MNTRPDWSVNGTGVGVYPVGAMLNHSCTPNVMQSFAGRRIIFRAIAPIAAGQEATISYVELSATRAERRAMLLAGYCFDIDAGRVCQYCHGMFPPPSYRTIARHWCLLL